MHVYVSRCTVMFQNCGVHVLRAHTRKQGCCTILIYILQTQAQIQHVYNRPCVHKQARTSQKVVSPRPSPLRRVLSDITNVRSPDSEHGGRREGAGRPPSTPSTHPLSKRGRPSSSAAVPEPVLRAQLQEQHKQLCNRQGRSLRSQNTAVHLHW